MYGAFLRQVRTSRHLTQAQLAANTGISQPNLSAYENDRRLPSLDVANRILVACGYELVALAGPRQIAAPLTPGGWDGDGLPDRLADDPPYLPYRPRPATMAERGEAAWEVLELAEAFG